jgi:hypothetical protein
MVYIHIDVYLFCNVYLAVQLKQVNNMTTESQAALAKLAADTKAVCATSADVTQAAAKPVAKGFVYHAKAAVLVHSIYLSAAGGILIGIAACHLANKYWLNRDK